LFLSNVSIVFFIDCLLLFLIFMDLLMVMFDVLSGFLMEVADDFCMAICVLQYHVGKTITNHPFRKGLYHLFLVIGRMDYYCFTHIIDDSPGMWIVLQCNIFLLFLIFVNLDLGDLVRYLVFLRADPPKRNLACCWPAWRYLFLQL